MKFNKQTHNRQLFLGVIWLIILALTVIGCNAVAAPIAPTAEAAQIIKSSVQFSWVDTIEFAGFYEAVDLGYYNNQGIEMRLDRGGLNDDGTYIDPIQRVIEGAADFGVTTASNLITARAKGQPLVAIAAIYQRSPIVLISLAKNNITRPQDLVGKRVGISAGTEPIYLALLASQKIDRQAITEVPVDISLEPLLKGQVDMRAGFITNEPITLKQLGQQINLILPSDYGVNIYSNVIFATEDTITQRPDLVENFLRATLQGYDQAINDPVEAGKAAFERNVSLDLAIHTASMQASLPLLKPAQSQVGMMDPKVWETTQQILLDQGSLSKPIDITTAYNLSFLDAIYKK